MDYNLFKGMVLTLRGGMDYGLNQQILFYNLNTTYGRPENGLLNRGDNKFLNLNLENFFTYTKSINDKHNISILGGYSITENTFQGLTILGSNFSTVALGYDNYGLAGTRSFPNTSKVRTRLLSYLGRFTYNFNNRYLFELSARSDGASNFAENKKRAFFPALSAGWIVTKEKFMQNQQLFSNLKLRGGYGLSGNQAIGAYQSLQSLQIYPTAQANGTPVNGMRQGNMGNPDLTWEETTNRGIGIDLGMLKNRIELSADYYSKTTKGLLTQITH
jgi:hypothetical protein